MRLGWRGFCGFIAYRCSHPQRTFIPARVGIIARMTYNKSLIRRCQLAVLPFYCIPMKDTNELVHALIGYDGFTANRL